MEGQTISTSTTDSEVASWQQVSALAYAFAGGYADAAGYQLARTFTGHVTGNLVLLAISLRHPDWVEIGQRFVATVTFSFATAVGFRVARFRSALSPWTLFLAGMLDRHIVSADCPRVSPLCCLACDGSLPCARVANGVVTSVGSVSLHATFTSGDLTTLTEEFSERLPGNLGKLHDQRRPPGKSKSTLLASVSLTFLVGAYSAALLIGRFGTLGPIFLLVPLCAAAALWSAPTFASPASSYKDLQLWRGFGNLLCNHFCPRVESLSSHWSYRTGQSISRDDVGHSRYGFVQHITYTSTSQIAVSRLVATGISFALCLLYLLIFPFNLWGLALLIGLGSITTTLVGRPNEIITTGITTTVVMVVAAMSPEHRWEQPL